MVVISVGSADVLRRALAPLAAALPDALVTLEPIALLKHDGERLDALPTPADVAGRDVWQTVRVYTRRSAQAGGAALFDELTRRLRESGAAGATTVLGEWGFSSDEPPTATASAGSPATARPTASTSTVSSAWPRTGRSSTS